MVEAVVRVGSKYGLRLRGIKVHRAITFKEVEARCNENTSLVIIEDPKEKEIDYIRKLVETGGYKVILYGIDVPVSTIFRKLNVEVFDDKISIQNFILKGYVTGQSSIGVSDNAELVRNSLTESIESIKSSIEDVEDSEEDSIKEFSSLSDTIDIGSKTNKELIVAYVKEAREHIGRAAETKGSRTQADSKLEKEIARLNEQLGAVRGQLNDAYGKISTLEHIKETVEDERDMYVDMLHNMEMESSVVEVKPADEAASEEDKKLLDEARAKLETLSIELNSVQKKASLVDELELQLNNKDDEIARLQGELAVASDKTEANSLKERIKEEVKSKLSVTNKLSAALQELSILRETLDSKVSEFNSLNAEYNSLSELSTDSVAKIQQLEAVVEERVAYTEKVESEFNKEKLGLQTQIDKIKSEKEKEITDTRERAIEEQNRLHTVITGLNSEIESLQEAIIKEEAKADTLQKGLDDANRTIAERDIKIQELELIDTDAMERTIEQLRDTNAKLSVEIEQSKLTAVNDRTEVSDMIERIQAEKESLEKRLKSDKEVYEGEITRLSKQNRELKSTSNEEISNLRVEVSTLQAKLDNKEKASENNAKQIEVLKTEFNSREAELLNQINELEAELTNVNKGFGDTSSGTGMVYDEDSISLSCNYKGKAKIITVFGSGSYGITTMAVSIAKKLGNSRVLFMDMDTVNPKGDRWFKKSPLIPELIGISSQLKRTAFGALLEKGEQYVIDNDKKIVRNVAMPKSSRGGTTIDYFSGIYTQIDMGKFLEIDFTKLMNFYGTKYDYIVVDLGRIGGSVATNSLANMLSRISHKVIMMTLSDSTDTRSLLVKLKANDITVAKALWVLNLVNTSKLDDMTKKNIGRIPYKILPKNMTGYGTDVTFDKMAMLRDHINQIIEDIIAG